MRRLFTLILLMACFSHSSYGANEARLMLYPNASKTQIAFVHGGDIYTVPVTGGLARRITSSEGIELFPRFSPDGKTIAFSAQYDGNREVYTMPAEGGTPERLTYSMDIPNLPERMGPDKIIMNWTADGNKIMYWSRKNSWNVLVGNLYYVDKNGSLPEKFQLPRAGFASLSPDGLKLAYNRIYREFRTWKRYRGGQADDIWIYDFKTKKIENVTNNPAQDIIPMWSGNKIYFISDRDHTLNLFCYDINTKQTRKITDFNEYDVQFPSLGPDYISFSNGGYIYLMDLKTEKVQKVNIEIAEDYPLTRDKFINVSDKIASFEISPDGNRALFTARGEIFTVPAEHGNIKNLTNTSGVHERNAVWSPDAKWIAFVSDKSGEDEVYIIKPDGTDLTQLTNNAKSYRFELKWSPDSKKIICSDKAMELYYIDVESKKTTVIAKSKVWEIRDYNWSPDNKWIVYTDYVENQIPVVFLYSLESGKTTQVTNEFFSSGQPAFSADGKYLFFLSDRTFDPRAGNFEYNFTIDDMTKIYGITLQSNLESPFAKFEDDEAKPVKDDSKSDDSGKDEKKEKKEKKDKKSDENIKIDMDNLMDRIFELPVLAGNYGGLTPLKDKLYYVRIIKGNTKLYFFDFEDKKEKEVGDFGAYEISGDGKKIIFKSGSDYYITKLSEKITPKDGKLNLSKLEVNLDRREEWKEVFNESWRQMKYFFYSPIMNGVDWNKIHDRYAALLPYVTHRYELTYLIGEMIGELNNGHCYTGGGDMPKVDKVGIGLLGCDFEESPSGFYKITNIYAGRNWEEKTRSPLTEPGLGIKEGMYILEIDGQVLSHEMHPFKALVNKVKQFVTLKVNTKPSLDGAREVSVKTIALEDGLIYYNWVETNRKKVDEATNGEVGYIQVPDMGFENGLIEFIKYFYPQTKKKALIIDDRYNGGGNVSPIIIERLRRVLSMAEHARNQEVVTTKPDAVMTGPLVCLINEMSMSDGDLFPYQFKTLGLGKLIGRRTWGGVIGIRGSLPLLDGGYLMKPEFANFGADGNWVIEGTGVYPDIDVDNDPAMEYEGVDQQLNKAIEVIKEEMKTDKKPKVPTVPPYPDKSK